MIRPQLFAAFVWPAALWLVGCTFQPGVSFGTLAEATLEARFQPPASRLDSEGRLKTSSGYRIRVDALQLVPRQLDFQSTTGKPGTGGTFDPANPPAGYSLCHGGHCHRDDGALVSYEDIQAELSGGSLSTATVLSLPLTAAFNLVSGTATASLTQGQPARMLERGTWSQASLQFVSLTASGSVEDPSVFDRLGGQSRSWSFTLSPEAVSRKISVRVDREEGDRRIIAATYELDAGLWDDVDFQSLGAGPLVLDQHEATRAQLLSNLAESQLSVNVTP